MESVREDQHGRIALLAEGAPAARTVPFADHLSHFYPELQQYGAAHANFAFNGPVWVDLLRHPVLTVPIHPVRRDDFAGRYGLSPDELLALADEGYVIPVVDCDLHRYHTHRSYCRPFLRHARTLFTVFRNEAALRTFDPEFDDRLQDVQSRLSAVQFGGSADDAVRGSLASYRRWFGSATGTEAFRKTVAVRVARLIALGGQPMDAGLLGPGKAGWLTEVGIRSALQLHPFTKGLGGIYQLPARLVSAMSGSSPASSRQEALRTLTSTICSDLQLDYPRSLPFDALMRLLRSGIQVELQRTLQTIVAACRRAELEPNENRVVPDAAALVSAWREAATVARRMSRGTKTMRRLAGGLMGVEELSGLITVEKVGEVAAGQGRLRGITNRISRGIDAALVAPDRKLQPRHIVAAFDLIEKVAAAVRMPEP